MFPNNYNSNLTESQVEQIKQAQRSNKYIGLTWQIFTIFVGQGERAKDALERAQDAIEVWKGFEDNSYVEMPEIEMPAYNVPVVVGPSFAEQMQEAARVMAAEFNRVRSKDVGEEMERLEKEGGVELFNINCKLDGLRDRPVPCCEASFNSGGEKHDRYCTEGKEPQVAE